MKKVLFILPNDIGGAERMTVLISKYLDTEKYEIKFVIVGRSIDDIKTYLPSGSQIEHIYIRNIWDFTTCKLIRLFRHDEPDIVFSSLRFLNVRVLAAAKLVGDIKTIVRNDNSIYTVDSLTRVFMRWTYPFADVVIAQQEEMAEEIKTKLPVRSERVMTLHNIVDTDLIQSRLMESKNPYPDANQTNYVAVCRITYQKGLDTLVKAFDIVHKDIDNAHLYIVGGYDESNKTYQELQALIESLNLRERVHFTGYQANPFVWEKYANCFVLSSRWEGLPNALIEAMYIGIPVVATTCIPIIERIVRNGYNGYLTDVDNIDGLAASMEKAVNLRDFKMTYKPSKPEDFVNLFYNL